LFKDNISHFGKIKYYILYSTIPIVFVGEEHIMSKKYDLTIIGGGAAGFSALVKYSEIEDGRIALVNHGPLGGTCVNVGCVPSKRLLHIANKIYEIKNTYGEEIDLKISRSGIITYFQEIRELVEQLRKSKYENILDKYDVDYIVGKGLLKDRHTIRVKGDKNTTIYSEKILIATGSSPIIPNIDRIKNINFYTSNTIWNLDRNISRILIVGSGAVGLEFSQAFNRLGIDTYVVEILDRVLPYTEHEISLELTRILEEEGIKLMLKSRVISVENRGKSISVKVASPQRNIDIEVDALLLATGRKPNSGGMNLERIGVNVDKRGMIIVNEYLRTNIPNIYAAGDVSSSKKPALLETISAKEGVIAAINISKGDKVKVDHKYVPVVIFTYPEVAYVGMTEKQVMDEIGACKCRLARFNYLAKSSIMDYSDGLAKIIVDPYTDIIKGFHILAPFASEFISIASLILKEGYKIQDVLDLPTVFPTVSEIIKLSAQAFIRRLDRMPCCVE
jgi:mercuric reductase